VNESGGKPPHSKSRFDEDQFGAGMVEPSRGIELRITAPVESLL
jgi:hypothetical protein